MIVAKSIEIDDRDISNIRTGLGMLLSRVYAELRVLQISRERELDEIEKLQLPHNLRDFSRDQLIEQVDAWISWAMEIEYLIKEASSEVKSNQGA